MQRSEKCQFQISAQLFSKKYKLFQPRPSENFNENVNCKSQVQFFWKEFYEYPVPLWFLLNCLGQTFQYMLSGRKRVFLCRVCQVCIIYFNFSRHKTIILFAKLLYVRQKYKLILNESICIFLGRMDWELKKNFPRL